MVVHVEIWVSGRIDGIPAHWRVRFGGSFFGERRKKERRGARLELVGGVGMWESGKLDATGRLPPVFCGKKFWEEIELFVYLSVIPALRFSIQNTAPDLWREILSKLGER